MFGCDKPYSVHIICLSQSSAVRFVFLEAPLASHLFLPVQISVQDYLRSLMHATEVPCHSNHLTFVVMSKYIIGLSKKTVVRHPSAWIVCTIILTPVVTLQSFLNSKKIVSPRLQRQCNHSPLSQKSWHVPRLL